MDDLLFPCLACLIVGFLGGFAGGFRVAAMVRLGPEVAQVQLVEAEGETAGA